MKPLPQESTGSFLGGIWFVFRHEAKTIRVWGSLITGKERVYVGDELVVQRHGFKYRTEIPVSSQGKNYLISVKVESITKGPVECSLSCDGVHVDTFVAKVIPKPFGKSLVALIIAWIAVAATLRTWFPNGPRWFEMVLFAIGTAAAFASAKGGGIVIEYPGSQQR